jgi:hypothetical protein
MPSGDLINYPVMIVILKHWFRVNGAKIVGCDGDRV